MKQPKIDEMYCCWRVSYHPPVTGSWRRELVSIELWRGKVVIVQWKLNRREALSWTAPPWQGAILSEKPLRIVTRPRLQSIWSEDGGLDLYG